jgi:hypothetical protein
MERMTRGEGPRGVVVLAVNMQEPRGLVARWVKDTAVTSPILMDAEGVVTRAYRVTATPTVVLVGRDGQLVGRAIGSRPWLDGKARALFEALRSP